VNQSTANFAANKSFTVKGFPCLAIGGIQRNEAGFEVVEKLRCICHDCADFGNPWTKVLGSEHFLVVDFVTTPTFGTSGKISACDRRFPVDKKG
jgi:hypothetical protein